MARAESDGVRGAFPVRNVALHLMMQIHGSGEEANAACAGAIFADGRDSSFVDAGMADETEVIVGREHEQLTPFGTDPGTGTSFKGKLERINAEIAGLAHEIEDAAGATVNQIFFAETPFVAFLEETVE